MFDVRDYEELLAELAQHINRADDAGHVSRQCDTAIRTLIAERDGLVEVAGKMLANLDALDDYMKQPDRGGYGVECAVCMGEWLEPEDRAVMERSRALTGAGK